MHTVSREYMFSAAHRIEGHERCSHLHGHNYHVRVNVTANDNDLDAKGMVIDFHKLDDICKPVINAWDHRYLVSNTNIEAGDPYYDAAREVGDAVWLPIKATTAELLSKLLYSHIASELDDFVGDVIHKISIDIWETNKSSATYEE